MGFRAFRLICLAFSSTAIRSMNKIVRIQSILDRLYPNPQVPLNYQCEFTFLCAVVLSAQTTDGKVNQVTDTLFKLASTPYAMSKMEESEVLKIIQPVGLAPSKTKYLINLSKMLVDKFNSKVPSSFEDLESLPGVGHKTASVVRSQIFGYPSLAVDTHVHRLALRWKLTKDQKNPNQVQKDLCQLFPEQSWSKLHLQMIYFGREYCTAKLHVNSECPICSWINATDSSSDEIEYATNDNATSVAPSFSSFAFSPSSSSSSSSSSTSTNHHHSRLHHDDELKVFTPKKTPKGIISYASRETEIFISPHLTPTLEGVNSSSININENGNNNNNNNNSGSNTVDSSIIESKSELAITSAKSTFVKKTNRKRVSIKNEPDSIIVNDSTIKPRNTPSSINSNAPKNDIMTSAPIKSKKMKSENDMSTTKTESSSTNPQSPPAASIAEVVQPAADTSSTSIGKLPITTIVGARKRGRPPKSKPTTTKINDNNTSTSNSNSNSSNIPTVSVQVTVSCVN